MSYNIFLDTNALIDILVDYQTPTTYDKIRSDAKLALKTKIYIAELIKNNPDIKLFINTTTVTNVFFILTNRQKISKSLVASQILNLHKQKELFTVVCEGDTIREAALNYCIQNDVDYEDALQYFCTLKHNCKAIITNDKNFPDIDIKLIRTYQEA